MKIKLILLSMLVTVMSYSQVKTFSAINVIDSLSLGGSPYMDTVIDISNYNGNLQVDSITANFITVQGDSIAGTTDTLSISELHNFITTPGLWSQTGLYIYPTDLSRWIGIGTATPRSNFEVMDKIVFNTNYAETAIGSNAGVPNGYRNTFVGHNTGRNIDYADNTAVGAYSLESSVHVRDNTAVGSWSGYNNTGNSNSFFGYRTGYNNTADYNVFVGYQSGYSNKGASNVFVGAGCGEANTIGTNNVFLGASSGNYNSVGNENVFIGTESGFVNTDGSGNTFTGYKAGTNNTASSNTFIGGYSGFNNTTGYTNTFIGSLAGYNNNVGHNNVLIGQNTGRNINSSYNTIIGESAGMSNQNGENNTYIGYYSAYGNYGANNTYIGTKAGYNSLTTFGSNNVFIGYNAGYNESESNKLYISNSNTTTPLIYGEFDNKYLHFNADSIDYTNAVAQYHLLDTLRLTSVDTWQDIKLDTNIANESTYGFKFNTDSTAIVVTTKGVIRVQGCLHWLYNDTTINQVNLYVRVLIDGIEIRSLQANSFIDTHADDEGTLPFVGTVTANYNSVIKLQVRVSDTDLILKGGSVFDNPVSASINFEKITYK